MYCVLVSQKSEKLRLGRAHVSTRSIFRLPRVFTDSHPGAHRGVWARLVVYLGGVGEEFTGNVWNIFINRHTGETLTRSTARRGRRIKQLCLHETSKSLLKAYFISRCSFCLNCGCAHYQALRHQHEDPRHLKV